MPLCLYNDGMAARHYLTPLNAYASMAWVVLLWALSACALADPWVLQDMAGKSHALSQYKGKWVLVNYWAPWCPPCLEEMPELVAFYDARKTQVMVIGVAVQYESVKSVQTYVDDMLISYPVVLGEAQKKTIVRPVVLPTTYIYQPDGRLFQIKQGTVSKQWLDRLLTENVTNTGH